MSEQSHLKNIYHNGATVLNLEERPELRQFYQAADQVLSHATELARVVASAHQAATALIVEGNWSQARKYFSLSDKYENWADYKTPATGYGIHAYIVETNQSLRLTQPELEIHPEWRNFGSQNGKHPSMRGWLVMPLIGADGLNYGLMQVTDRYEGDFTAGDEANLGRLVKLTSTALDALAQAYLAEYREKVANLAKSGL
jgi:GAF domain-containing protein